MRWFGVWFNPKQCSGLRSIGPKVQPLFSAAGTLVSCLPGGEQHTEQRSGSFLRCRLGGGGGHSPPRGDQAPQSALVKYLMRALTSCSSTEWQISVAPGKHWEDLQVLMHGSDRLL